MSKSINQNIIIKCKKFFPPNLFNNLISPILPLLDNPSAHQWIKNNIEQAINYLKSLKPIDKDLEDYLQVLNFFEDELISVTKAIQDGKCNPFRSVNFHTT